MDIAFELIWLKPPRDDSVDYSSLIFKIKMEKKLNLDNSNDLWIFFRTIVDGGGKNVIIDMSNLSFIDSSGIGILINTAKLIRQSKGDIVLINVSTDIYRILELVNFQRFIKVFEKLGDAKDHFSKS